MQKEKRGERISQPPHWALMISMETADSSMATDEDECEGEFFTAAALLPARAAQTLTGTSSYPCPLP